MNAPSDVRGVMPRWKTVGELLRSLGDVPAERVYMNPLPGTATEAEAYWFNEHDRTCELVNRTVVEKKKGLPQCYIAGMVTYYLFDYVHGKHERAGIVFPAGPMYRMKSGNLRSPDASFTQWERFTRPLPEIADWCPDLCIDVPGPLNTPAELSMKREEYFESGCKLAWEIDLSSRSATIFSDSGRVDLLDENGFLEGLDVLPGFQIRLIEILEHLDRLNSRKE